MVGRYYARAANERLLVVIWYTFAGALPNQALGVEGYQFKNGSFA
jgi:hypothetical protein